MASQTIHLKAGEAVTVINQVVLDASGKSVSYGQSGNTSDDATVHYESSFGKFIGMKAGSAAVSVTFSNSSGAITVNAAGDLNGTDTIVVDANPPASATYAYSSPA